MKTFTLIIMFLAFSCCQGRESSPKAIRTGSKNTSKATKNPDNQNRSTNNSANQSAQIDGKRQGDRMSDGVIFTNDGKKISWPLSARPKDDSTVIVRVFRDEYTIVGYYLENKNKDPKKLTLVADGNDIQDLPIAMIKSVTLENP